MSKDLSKILEGWDYQPDDVTVRLIDGDDGTKKVQLRLDLGVLQMEMDGRPDRQTPGDCPSWLDYYEQKQQAHDAAGPDSAAFELKEEDCLRLWHEGVQYYHRYLSFWHLKIYDLCARDTARNLRLFAFVGAHTDNDRHRLQFDQWRPYVTMMNVRAVATPLIDEARYDEALRVIESGIEAIRSFLDEYDQTDSEGGRGELAGLERWHVEVLAEKAGAADARPKPPEAVLREKLQEAIDAEEFEQAAQLRDEIRRIKAEGKGKETDEGT
ncbi:MAG TPA: UvrB/UvrC motif-containing protein [Thermoguttaceae bacterium]|nr:UvrB/UvrC motif-containing protein [Thermoguttaceae bacterium]